MRLNTPIGVRLAPGGRFRNMTLWTNLSLGLVLGSLLAACGSDPGKTVYPEKDWRRVTGSQYEDPGSLFGDDGLDLFGNGEALGPDAGGGGSGIGVNTYLWRASLDTISFMPLASADPFGGVIITDWYSPPETSSERFKVNLFILGRDLRADGLRARVFRQQRDGVGGWSDISVGEDTPVDLENAILTRARQLRIAALQ